MSDVQATSEPTSTTPVVAANTVQPSASNDVVSRLEREVQELRKEAADRRIAAKQSAESAAQEAAKAGDYRKQAELYQQQLDELKPKLAMVDEAQEFMTASAREIDALKPTLPTYMQTAIDNAPSLKVKREIVAQYQAAQPQTQQRAQPIPAANPANPTSPLGLDSFHSADDVRRAADSDPVGFRAMLGKLANQGRPQSAIGAMFGRK
jgi:hypothetical protein